MLKVVTVEQVVLGWNNKTKKKDRQRMIGDPVGILEPSHGRKWPPPDEEKQRKKRVFFLLLFSWLEAICYFWVFCVYSSRWGRLSHRGPYGIRVVFGGVGLLASQCLFNDILFFFIFLKRKRRRKHTLCFVCFSFHSTGNLIGQSRDFYIQQPMGGKDLCVSH